MTSDKTKIEVGDRVRLRIDVEAECTFVWPGRQNLDLRTDDGESAIVRTEWCEPVSPPLVAGDLITSVEQLDDAPQWAVVAPQSTYSYRPFIKGGDGNDWFERGYTSRYWSAYVFGLGKIMVVSVPAVAE